MTEISDGNYEGQETGDFSYQLEVPLIGGELDGQKRVVKVEYVEAAAGPWKTVLPPMIEAVAPFHLRDLFVGDTDRAQEISKMEVTRHRYHLRWLYVGTPAIRAFPVYVAEGLSEAAFKENLCGRF